ncbi:hypothetical protein MPSEU_000489900 [Mayamaea pseudoterrestris]|nr:hypothetical protein MPSEU_000489900 [Mayamaea pseudoterrestris]
MASTSFSSPPPSALFKQRSKSPLASSEKKDVNSLENPFLARGLPLVRTSKGESNSPVSSPISTPQSLQMPLKIAPTNELRNRKNIHQKSVPPKSSIYLGNGGDFGSINAGTNENVKPSKSNLLLLGSASSDIVGTSGCWILVYGYTTHEQFKTLLNEFSSYGRVVDYKSPSGESRQNWLALQYESRLEAEKALCHDDIQIDSGVYCGVKRLSDNDPIILFDGSKDDLPQLTGGPTLIPVENDEVETMEPKDERVQGVGERFLRWALSIH